MFLMGSPIGCDLWYSDLWYVSNVMCARCYCVCVCSVMLQASCDCFLTGNSLFPTSFCLFLFIWIIFTPLFLSQAPHNLADPIVQQ